MSGAWPSLQPLHSFLWSKANIIRPLCLSKQNRDSGICVAFIFMRFQNVDSKKEFENGKKIIYRVGKCLSFGYNIFILFAIPGC